MKSLSIARSGDCCLLVEATVILEALVISELREIRRVFVEEPDGFSGGWLA